VGCVNTLLLCSENWFLTRTFDSTGRKNHMVDPILHSTWLLVMYDRIGSMADLLLPFSIISHYL
jgi:hypothetical protein